MTGDEEFVKAIYPRMTAMMEFLGGQLDENGFIVGREGDWIFVDWADMDKEGAICAEQMLLAMCYQTMAQADELVLGDGSAWEKKYQAIVTHFGDLGSLEQLPGFAIQRLMEKGYGFGGEGDWKTAAMGIEAVYIDGDTTIRNLQNELRWNSMYFSK